MDIAEFDYDLPPELIAQEPLPERDASRLLVLDRRSGETSHHAFRELPSLLAPGDLLVVNRSRVIPARLLGRRASGGEAEVLLVRDRGDGRWEALVRPGRHLRPGQRVTVDDDLSVVIESEALREDGTRRTTRYDIDLTKCIFCGFCEESCPVDSIVETRILEYHGERRGDLIYTKEMLLAVGDRHEAEIAADREADAKFR